MSIFGDFDLIRRMPYDIGDPVSECASTSSPASSTTCATPTLGASSDGSNALRLLDTLGPQYPSSEIPRYRTLRAELLEGG